MSKVVLPPVTGGYNLSRINQNFQEIAEALNEGTLWRDNPVGEPNEMKDDLDMNGHHIYNLPRPVLDHEPARYLEFKQAEVNLVAAENAARASEASAIRSENAADRAEDAAEIVQGWEGVVGSLGYMVPVPYAAGLSVTIPTFTVEYNGQVYAPYQKDLPFTTGAVFDASKWRLIQGVVGTDLAAVGGSSLVGHSNGINGRAVTVKEELQNHLLHDLNPNIIAIQPNTIQPSLSREPQDWLMMANGNITNSYHHGQGLCRDNEGRLHATYYNGLLHGYGGLTEANAVDPQGKTLYRYSDDNGATWSPEQIVATALPHDPENPFRSTFGAVIGVTMSGRVILVVNDVPPPSSQWGRYTGQTKYRLFTNDKRGDASAWVDRGVIFSALDDYARVYGSRVKIIPKQGGGYRLAFTDYRRYQLAPAAYMMGMWYSDDDGLSFQEGTPLMVDDGSKNETDFTFVDANYGIAVSRADITIRVTKNGGASWTKIGNQSNYPAAITRELVSPIIDTVVVRGTPHVIMGYAERTGTRMIRWLIATVKDIQKFETEVIAGRLFRPWGNVYQSGPSFTGSGGYPSAVHYGDGQVCYLDCTETTVSPTTGYMRADTRFVRFNSLSWFPIEGGIVLKPSSQRLTQYARNGIPSMPTFVATATPGTPVYGSQQITGVRTGDVYRFHGQMGLTSLGGASEGIRIAGLPYTYGNEGFQCLVEVKLTSGILSSLRDTHEIIGLIINNTKYIQLYKRNLVSGVLGSFNTADLSSDAFSCYFSGHYTCRYEDEP